MPSICLCLLLDLLEIIVKFSHFDLCCGFFIDAPYQIYKLLYILVLISCLIYILFFSFFQGSYFYLTLLFYSSLFYFMLYCTACGILVPITGIEPTPPCIWSGTFNHWTTKAVPVYQFLLNIRIWPIFLVSPQSIRHSKNNILRLTGLFPNKLIAKMYQYKVTKKKRGERKNDNYHPGFLLWISPYPDEYDSSWLKSMLPPSA